MLTVSIIVPVYNSAACLSECLRAIDASDYAHYECIVVNDGSTDGSRAVAAQFPVQILDLGGGPFGPAYARNRAAEQARGDILFFVDADVLIPPDAVALLAATFEARPDVDAVFGSYDDTPHAPNFVSQYKNLFHHFVHQEAREVATTFWSGCGGIRRDVFLKMQGFDESTYARPSIEDIELGYRLTAGGHKIRLNKDIQVKHLKRWTLPGMVKSDVFDRGIPWTLLSLSARNLPADLNLRPSQRLCALLAGVMLLSLALTALFGVSWPWLAMALLSMCLIVLLNYRFYAFFTRKRGILFSITVLPFHVLYYLYSALAFALGAALYVRRGRLRRWPWLASSAR